METYINGKLVYPAVKDRKSKSWMSDASKWAIIEKIDENSIRIHPDVAKVLGFDVEKLIMGLKSATFL